MELWWISSEELYNYSNLITHRKDCITLKNIHLGLDLGLQIYIYPIFYFHHYCMHYSLVNQFQIFPNFVNFIIYMLIIYHQLVLYWEWSFLSHFSESISLGDGIWLFLQINKFIFNKILINSKIMRQFLVSFRNKGSFSFIIIYKGHSGWRELI